MSKNQVQVVRSMRRQLAVEHGEDLPHFCARAQKMLWIRSRMCAERKEVIEK